MFTTTKTALLATAFVVLASGTLAQTKTSGSTDFEPDMEDLQLYLACNALAESRPLSFGEAAACSIAIQRLKLSFVSNLSLEDYDRLPVEKQADANIRGYRAFRAWLLSDPIEVQKLKSELRANATPVTD